ncbi:AEC family transporter [Methylobacterium sp. WL122]|nr:AEC family transporter [Methylobacterium sp. WL122]
MFSTLMVVLPIFALVFAGWLMRRCDVLGDGATAELNRYVVYLALPALLFDVIGHTHAAEIWQPGFIAVFGLSSLIVFSATVAFRLRRPMPLADAAIDGLNAAYANTGFMGFPLALVALGPAALAPTTIAAIMTVCVVFAVAIVLIEIGLQGQGQGRRAELVLKVARSLVRPPRVQLEGGGRALDVGPVQARDEAVGQVLQGAEAEALGREPAAAAEGQRVLARHRQVVSRKPRRRAGGAVALDPPGCLEAQAVADVELLEQVGGVRPGIGRRQQGARLARGPDLAPPGLEAERAGQRAEGGEDRHVLQLDAALGLAVLEGRLHPVDPVLAEADLLVLVDRAAGPEPDHLERSFERPILAAGQHPVLVRVQARAAVGRLAAWDLIERVVVAERDPDEAAVADRRDADRAALRAVGGVRLEAGGRVVAVGPGPEAVGVDRDVLRARVDRAGHEPAVVDAGIPGGDLAGIAPRRDEGRHAVVLGGDHAADRLAAVAQGRRPADHLDPVGDQRVDRHAVVLAEFRDVLDADAVLLDSHPAVVEAADDRAAGRARGVGRGRDAGPVHQRVAEGPRLLAGDLVARHHRHRREGVDGHRHDAGRQARIRRRLRTGLDRARRGDAELG